MGTQPMLLALHAMRCAHMSAALHSGAGMGIGPKAGNRAPARVSGPFSAF